MDETVEELKSMRDYFLTAIEGSKRNIEMRQKYVVALNEAIMAVEKAQQIEKAPACGNRTGANINNQLNYTPIYSYGQFIFCQENTCKDNMGSICMNRELHIGPVQTGIEQGREKIFPVCSDYKEMRDIETDREQDGS